MTPQPQHNEQEPRELPQYAPLSVELTFTAPAVNVGGVVGPLEIKAHSLNEVRRYIALLKQNGLLVEPQPQHASSDEAPMCPVHHRAMKPSKKPGAWYCPSRVGDGYCDQKVG